MADEKSQSSATPSVAEPKQYEASIVIVSFNTCAVLRESLLAATRECAALEANGRRAEILVVDNGSHDGSLEMVEAEFPHVKLTRSPENLGFGLANNIAIEQARGRYVVLINSDAFFSPGSLALAICHMDQTPQAGAGGAHLIGRDGAWQPSGRGFPSVSRDLIVHTGLADRFPRSRVFGRMNRTCDDLTLPAQVDWIVGAFIILRPEALKQVGLFDPAFFLYYEEVDLCLRLRSAGWQCWYWPDLVITHVGGESSRRLTSLEFSSRAAQVVLWRMRSMLLYYRKHHGVQVRLARALEHTLYTATVLRNRFSRTPERRDRERHHRTLNALLNQAWTETRGGRTSPPRPW